MLASPRRYYHPWDPLQLSAEVESGLAVRKNSILFALYRRPGTKYLFTPLLHDHLVCFYGETHQVDTLVGHLASQSKHIPVGSCTMTFYDIGGVGWPRVDELDQECTPLKSVPYEDSPLHFLGALEEHLRTLEERSAELNSVEAPNKQVQILMCAFSDDAWNELVDDEGALVLLDDILARAPRQRVYVWLFARTADALPELLLSRCSYGLFLGEENAEYAERYHFPDRKTSSHAPRQRFDGVAWIRGEDGLYPVHPLKFTPSEYAKAKVRQVEEEEELYRRYLATLDDGE